MTNFSKMSLSALLDEEYRAGARREGLKGGLIDEEIITRFNKMFELLEKADHILESKVSFSDLEKYMDLPKTRTEVSEEFHLRKAIKDLFFIESLRD